MPLNGPLPASSRTRTVTLSAVETRAIDNFGCAAWLHAVDDGGTYVVLSGEANNAIYVKLFDPDDAANDATLPQWELLLDFTRDIDPHPAITAYTRHDGSTEYCNGLADHWHVYAHGYHWIAVSLIDDTYSAEGISVYLIKFTVDPTTGVPVIVDEGLIWSPYSTADDYTSSGNLQFPTNDLFLVPTPGGLAIGLLSRPDSWSGSTTPGADQGTLILRVSTTLTLRAQVEVLGGLTAGATGHDYGASATMPLSAPAGAPIYRILAPECLSVAVPSGLMLITAYRDWSVDAVSTAKAKDTAYNLSMPTEAELAPRIGGWDPPRAMLYKKVDITSAVTDGQILLDTFDSTGATVDSEYVIASTGERPHLLFRDDLLLCCWEDTSVPTCYITIVRATVS